MNFTERQHKVLELVRTYHEGQTRKYTGAAYVNHPIDVASLVASQLPENNELGIEIALCHDLFEDTECSYLQLMWHLTKDGYKYEEASDIVIAVAELTDVYTAGKFPDLNRQERKSREAHRLAGVSSIAQTVKYADLIDNTKSIVKHDPKFAVVYLAEKEMMLEKMTDGNPCLRAKCQLSLRKSINQL